MVNRTEEAPPWELLQMLLVDVLEKGAGAAAGEAAGPRGAGGSWEEPM